ncbi:MAG: hypothetical protein PHP88_02195 [bacterium]|nr:hypothetical protein [bacterium]
MKGSRSVALWGATFLLLAFSTLMSARISPMRLHGVKNTAARESYGVLALISKTPYFYFGFRNLLADVVWLEAVQTAGNKRMEEPDYQLLSRQLNLVADFAPRFAIPYLLGGLVLSESPGHAGDALVLLARGKPYHPNDWRFPFYMGYTRYFSFGEATEAGRAMREAARLPGSPPYLPLLAARMLSEAKDPEAALNLLETVAGQEGDPVRRSALERRMREVAVERDLQSLEKAVEKYLRMTGSFPGTLRDLIETGVIGVIPREPNGGRYLLEPGGKVRSDRVAQRLRVFRNK